MHKGLRLSLWCVQYDIWGTGTTIPTFVETQMRKNTDGNAWLTRCRFCIASTHSGMHWYVKSYLWSKKFAFTFLSHSFYNAL